MSHTAPTAAAAAPAVPMNSTAPTAVSSTTTAPTTVSNTTTAQPGSGSRLGDKLRGAFDVVHGAGEILRGGALSAAVRSSLWGRWIGVCLADLKSRTISEMALRGASRRQRRATLLLRRARTSMQAGWAGGRSPSTEHILLSSARRSHRIPKLYNTRTNM